jgi:hypothetical protein
MGERALKTPQQAGREAPSEDEPDRTRQMAAMQQRRDERSQEPPLDLEVESQKDPVAAQKLADIKSEKAPRVAEKIPEFLAGATKKLNDAYRGRPLDALRQEVTENGTKYLGLGQKLPMEELVGHRGISRLLDLPGLWKYKYLKPEVRETYPDSKKFVDAAKRGHFNPSADLDNSRELAGKAQETWWFPTDGADAGADLGKLREALYIQDDANYAEGAVRLDLPPAECETLGIEVFKPTAFDGVMQGWGTDPWWRPSEHPNWGLTKNQTKEAVMLAQKLGTFRHRTLVLDGAPANGGAKANGGANANSGAKANGGAK